MVAVVLALLKYLNSLVFWLDDVHRCKILLKIKKKFIQLFAQYQAEIMRKQGRQTLYFKTMVYIISYCLSMASVTYGLLAKGKRINLSVTFSLFANRKHRKPTTAKSNYQNPEQSSLLFSLRSSPGAHLSEN